MAAMRRYAAFLRGVSPMNAKMPELKRCFEAAGFTEVKPVLSSGNVVFGARASSEASLERKVETAMKKQLGEARAADRARWRAHPERGGQRGVQRLRPRSPRTGLHDAHREDVRPRGHDADLGVREEGGGLTTEVTRSTAAGTRRAAGQSRRPPSSWRSIPRRRPRA